jgi:hypothetical protein
MRTRAEQVVRHQLAPMEVLHRLRSDPRLHLLAQELEGYQINLAIST